MGKRTAASGAAVARDWNLAACAFAILLAIGLAIPLAHGLSVQPEGYGVGSPPEAEPSIQ